MVYLDFPDLVRGDTVKIPIAFTVNGAVVDITGWGVYMTVKEFENQPDSDAIIEVNVLVHPDPTQGKTIIVLTEADTQYTAGTYWYDLAFVDLSGNKTTVLIGHMTFFKNMTTRV